MKKKEFLNALRKKLEILESSEVDDIITEYSGYIDEKMESGVSEENAVEAFGNLDELANDLNIKVYYPEPILCTDNAAMIAAAGYYNYINGERAELNLNAIPNLKIGE